MKLAVITANCGGFDPIVAPVAQLPPEGFGDVAFIAFDDANFAPRRCAMTSRLQARIPKMFGWEMAPGFDVYIWHDASYSMQRPDAAAWFVDQMAEADAAFFRHPHRRCVRDEAEYIRDRVAAGDRYLTRRYAGELIDEQLAAIEGVPDDLLIASSAFVYRNTWAMRSLLRDWWVHTSRYHAVDQLALPFLLWVSGITYNLIEENIYEFPYLTRTREAGR